MSRESICHTQTSGGPSPGRNRGADAAPELLRDAGEARLHVAGAPVEHEHELAQLAALPERANLGGQVAGACVAADVEVVGAQPQPDAERVEHAQDQPLGDVVLAQD